MCFFVFLYQDRKNKKKRNIFWFLLLISGCDAAKHELQLWHSNHTHTYFNNYQAIQILKVRAAEEIKLILAQKSLNQFWPDLLSLCDEQDNLTPFYVIRYLSTFCGKKIMRERKCSSVLKGILAPLLIIQNYS